MQLYDGQFSADLSVTDIRLYADDHVTRDARAVAATDRRLRRGTPIIISVGLTRAFATGPTFPPVHWMQVNNLHLEDDPLWRRG